MADISKIQIQNGVYNIKDETARNSINTINDQITDINDRLNQTKKYVFMGDSYGDGYSPDGNTISWINLLVQKLGLSSSQYISTHMGGYRFAYSSSDYNYILLLNQLQNDDDLSDMYVCGGYNDKNHTASDIKLGIQNFQTLFNQKFPNAKLHLGFIGWSKNGSRIRELANTFVAYKKACDDLQIDFLDGCEYSLHNYFKYFSSDDIHPNQNGQNSIANALYDCIVKNRANVVEKEGIGFTVENGNVYNATNLKMILKNGKIDFVLNGGSASNLTIAFDTAITQSGLTPVKIATLTNSLIYGSDYNDCVLAGIPCVVYDGSSYSKQVLDFIFKDGSIYVVNAGASGGSYQSITLKQIQIPAGLLSIEALYC